jgi:hypothetical protein
LWISIRLLSVRFYFPQRTNDSLILAVINPDSAVAIDKKREAQSFRSEVDGFLPLSRHRSAVLRGDVKPHSNDLRKAQNDFETSQSDAFAAPGFHLASGNCGIRDKRVWDWPLGNSATFY